MKQTPQLVGSVFVGLEVFYIIEKTRKTKVHSQLTNSPKYFQGEPHVQWYSMNEDELDDGEMVVGMPKVHILNTKAYLLDPPM